MTTEKEVKKTILETISKTIKVKKTFNSMGHDHTKNVPVKLEDFDISFEIPFDFGATGFVSAYHRKRKNNKFEGDIRIRTLSGKQRKET